MPLKRLIPILTTLLSAFTIFECKAQYVSLNGGEVSRLRQLITTDTGVQHWYEKWKRLADEALTDDPHPIDTIRTEGLLKGNPKKTATGLALRDMSKIYAMALSYRVSGDTSYLARGTAFLMAWALANTPNGDPIDDTNLDGAIEGYDLLRPAMSLEDAAIITGWLEGTALSEIHGPRNQPGKKTAINNWNSHRLKIIGEIGYAIEDTALQQYAIRGLKKQVEQNLLPDGSSIDFAERDALHYHVYDLEPLLKLCILLQRATGANYYSWQSAGGASIQKSVNWLLPYLNGEKTHPEFVHSTVSFDKARAMNNEPGYQSGALFDPKNGASTLCLAAYFNKDLLQVARQVQGKDAPYPAWQSVLNKLMKN